MNAEQTEPGYHFHCWCQNQLIGLQWYLNEVYNNNKDSGIPFQLMGIEIPQALQDYETYLQAHIQQNPPSIFDLPESEYHMPDDGRYPSDQFLISLSESGMPDHSRKTYDRLMRIISDTWYCMRDEDVIDYEGGRYELYDGKWSGNKDITDAILRNPSIVLLCDIDTSTCVLKIRYRFADRDENELWV